jgi:hypothetical protein
MCKEELRQAKARGEGGEPKPLERRGHRDPSEARDHRDPPGKGPSSRSRAASTQGRSTPHKDVSAGREEGARSWTSCGDDAHHRPPKCRREKHGDEHGWARQRLS